MAGLLQSLRRGACSQGVGLLQQLEHVAASNEVLLSQASCRERCSSGAGASTSASAAAAAAWWPAGASAPRQKHTATLSITHTSNTSSLLSDGPAAGPLPSLTAAPAAPGTARSAAAMVAHALPIFRGFATAATAAVPATAPSPGGGGGGGGGGGASAGVQAPWPWVDPARPQVLPTAIRRPRRTPVPLTTALQQLLEPLTPGQRSSHSLEVFLRFGLDPRRSDHLVRGSVILPYGTGKAVRLVVFAKGADADIAREEGVDLIGDEELISAIVASEGAAITFDKLIATPDFMRPLARAGKVLGPKGLMPNPKMGTLTTNVARAIRETRRGRLDYRLGRDGAVRAALGRASMPAEQLAANIGGLVASLLDNKPKAVGGPPTAVEAPATGAGSAAASPAALTAAQLAGSLDGYIRTFLVKTTRSAPVAVTFESLLEAVGPARALIGASEQQQGAQAAQQPAAGAAAGAATAAA